jgi:hypothetical protein
MVVHHVGIHHTFYDVTTQNTATSSKFVG